MLSRRDCGWKPSARLEYAMTTSLPRNARVLALVILLIGCGSSDPCAKVACSDHGLCSAVKGEATCTCDEGYAGALCGNCAAGYQDNDNSGTCQPTCAASGLVCHHGECSDAQGTAACVCAATWAGADCQECAEGYQDNDHNDICKPTCAKLGYTCSDHGSCSDASGTAVCICDDGYFADGEGGCQAGKDWTFIVYINGQNDLEPYGDENIDQMKVVGSNQDVDIIALFGRYPTSAKKIYVNQGSTTIVEDMGSSIDLGDWHVLAEFGVWAVDNYPSKHYALILWDHGEGWRMVRRPPTSSFKGFSTNYSTGREISIAEGEYANALALITAAAGGKLEMIGFDACLMQSWEVAEASEPYAKWLVASQDAVPGSGWPYTPILTALAANPEMTGLALGTNVADEYHDASAWNSTMSVVNLESLPAFDSALSSLADALGQHSAQFGELETARESAIQFYMDGFVDLGDFLDRVKLRPGVTSDVTAAANAMLTQLGLTVPHNRTQIDYADAHGLTIYVPERGGGLESLYTQGTGAVWAQRSTWDEFLMSFTD